jgi:phosphomannomutase
VDRIQGTDGIRRDVRRQDDPSLAGLSPWEAFVERGVITDAFMEGYAYAFARLRLDEDPASAEVVVGWDPRDPSGDFTGAVVRGLRKAGAAAAVMGVAPTPAVPMYMAYRGAAAGLMVTASHNPAGQNGVKIFLAPAGLKLLPADDRRLTAAVAALNWAEVAAAEPRGGEVDVSSEWREVFTGFHLAECNSWLAAGETPLADFVLVVDPARGSYSGTAAEVLRAYGADVVEVNADAGDGLVNWRSGVADLEGVASISFDDVSPGGRFAEYPALAALDKLAGEYDAALATGESLLAGVIFDADGDRLFLVVYDPTAGEFVVLSGDEVAILQAAELARRLDGAGGRAFINTVESDLAVAGAAASLGFDDVLKPVGDKWILTEAWRLRGDRPRHNLRRPRTRRRRRRAVRRRQRPEVGFEHAGRDSGAAKKTRPVRVVRPPAGAVRARL